MGIEPTTSPTLKENHTTRPMARTVTPCLQFDNLFFQKGQKATRKKGATGIEPVTAGSAIPCSTAELCAQSFNSNIVDPYDSLPIPAVIRFFTERKKKKWLSAPEGTRTPDPGLIRPMLYQLSYQSDITPVTKNRIVQLSWQLDHQR